MIDLTRKAHDLLKVLFTPSCWLQHADFSSAWDHQLNSLMATNKFIVESPYTARLGQSRVWIANHPYASFTPEMGLPKVRPRRITILKAYEKMMNDVFSEQPTSLPGPPQQQTESDGTEEQPKA
jgi:hypothetical protein